MPPVPVVLQTTAVSSSDKEAACDDDRGSDKANALWFEGGMENAGGERNAMEHYAYIRAASLLTRALTSFIKNSSSVASMSSLVTRPSLSK